jgi:hypothetical protein
VHVDRGQPGIVTALRINGSTAATLGGESVGLEVRRLAPGLVVAAVINSR